MSIQNSPCVFPVFCRILVIVVVFLCLVTIALPSSHQSLLQECPSNIVIVPQRAAYPRCFQITETALPSRAAQASASVRYHGSLASTCFNYFEKVSDEMPPLLPAWSSGLEDVSEELLPLLPTGATEEKPSSFYCHLQVLSPPRDMMNALPRFQRSVVAAVF